MRTDPKLGVATTIPQAISTNSPTGHRQFREILGPGADKLIQYPERIRAAITSARLVKGMTREQVLMAVGYPVSSENAHLDSNVWRFWLSSFAEFRVRFDDQQRVSDVEADDVDTRDKVLMQ